MMRLPYILVVIILVFYPALAAAVEEDKSTLLAVLIDYQQANRDLPDKFLSLLEVELSQIEGIRLLERAQIDKILQEQRLSVAGLLERDTAVKVGRLLRADAFIILSLESAGIQAEPDRPPPRDEFNEEAIPERDSRPIGQLIRVRVAETAHGLRLLDSFKQLDNSNLEETTAGIINDIDAVIVKLTQPAGQAIPVGIVDIHRVQLGKRHRLLERALPVLLSVRLSKEPKIIMLEREDLKILLNEKLLTESDDTEFWSSAVLIDGYLQLKGREDIEMKLRLKRASGDDIAVFTVLVEPNEPLTAVGKAASDIIRELLNAPPTAQWQPKQEAEEFFGQGQLLYEHTRYRDAIAPLETAHALQPENVFYTGALFSNEWALRFRKGGSFHSEGTGISHYTDLELAELVSLLVRQIRDGYEKSSLSVRDIYYRWASPSGPLRIGRWRSKSYFTNPVSVSTEQIRMINRENRRIWVETMDKALKQQLLREDYPQMNTRIRACLFWASSDDPEQLMSNLKKAFVEFVMPPEMGGKIKSPQERSRLYDQVFRMPSGLRSGSSDIFSKLWRRYLPELTKLDDSVVRFNSCLDLGLISVREPNEQDTTQAKYYALEALKVFTQQPQGPDEPFLSYRKLDIKRLKQCLEMLEIGYNEKIRIWEEIYEPLIEKKDVDSLVLWDPGSRAERFIDDSGASQQPMRRFYELLEKIAVVLDTRKNDMQVRKTLNIVRDAQALIRNYFPRLDFAYKSMPLPVTILLKKEGWLGQRYRYIRDRYLSVKLQENMLWLAFIEEPGNHKVEIRLAGIDLAQKKLAALWQPEVSFTSYPILTGIVISENATYLSIKGVGLVEFPGSLAEGRKFLKNPKVLSQEHGLPSVFITSVAKKGNKLWIAYGEKGQESGLGLYDPRSGHWETILCSTLKGEPPFNAGQPYVLYGLKPALPDKLFFVLYDPRHSRNMERWTGLWKMDTNTRELRHLGFGGISSPGMGHIVNSGDKWWFKTPSSLIEFDYTSEKARFVLGEPWWIGWPFAKTASKLECESNFFVPEPEGLSYGNYMSGYLDLSTAAVHVDKLWARLGRSQIIIIQRGKSLAEAEVIENNILNGGAVMRFLSTPYGLIAVGEGTVGLIETKG